MIAVMQGRYRKAGKKLIHPSLKAVGGLFPAREDNTSTSY
jgi:hypothetical protein